MAKIAQNLPFFLFRSILLFYFNSLNQFNTSKSVSLLKTMLLVTKNAFPDKFYA